MQVVGHILPLDGVTDEEELAVAQLLGNIEGADGGDEHHADAGEHPRQAQRPHHPAQDLQIAAAQILGRLQQAVVHFGHHRINGHDHIGEIVIDHAHHHGGLGADDVHRPQTHQVQQSVEDAGILQNGHPGIGADEEVHPHGDHDQGDHGLLGAGGGPGDDIGHGIAHQQADDGGDDCQLQRPPEDQQIGVDLLALAGLVGHAGGGGKELDHIVQGEAELVVGKSVIGDERQRHQNEQRGPHGIGRQQQVFQRQAPAAFSAAGHSARSLSAGTASGSMSRE